MKKGIIVAGAGVIAIGVVSMVFLARENRKEVNDKFTEYVETVPATTAPQEVIEQIEKSLDELEITPQVSDKVPEKLEMTWGDLNYAIDITEEDVKDTLWTDVIALSEQAFGDGIEPLKPLVKLLRECGFYSATQYGTDTDTFVVGDDELEFSLYMIDDVRVRVHIKGADTDYTTEIWQPAPDEYVSPEYMLGG